MLVVIRIIVPRPPADEQSDEVEVDAHERESEGLQADVIGVPLALSD